MSHGKNIHIRKKFYLLFQRAGIKYLTNISGSVVSKHESEIFKQRNWRAPKANQSQREQTGKEKRNGRHQRSKRLALHNIYIIKSQELRTESMPKGTFVFLRSLDLYFSPLSFLPWQKKSPCYEHYEEEFWRKQQITFCLIKEPKQTSYWLECFFNHMDHRSWN